MTAMHTICLSSVAGLAILALAACTPFEIDNAPPVAEAGDDRSLAAPGEITLDGSESFDPDGTIVSWHWRFGGEIPGTVDSDEDAGPPLTADQKLLLPAPAFCAEPPDDAADQGPIALRYCDLEPDRDPAKATIELEEGGYRFTLFVEDNEGAVSADSVEIRIGE